MGKLGRFQGIRPPPGNWAAFRESGRLQKIRPPLRNWAASRKLGHHQGIGPPPGIRVTSRYSGRLQGLGPPPGTRAASRNSGSFPGNLFRRSPKLLSNPMISNSMKFHQPYFFNQSESYVSLSFKISSAPIPGPLCLPFSLLILCAT